MLFLDDKLPKEPEVTYSSTSKFMYDYVVPDSFLVDNKKTTDDCKERLRMVLYFQLLSTEMYVLIAHV